MPSQSREPCRSNINCPTKFATFTCKAEKRLHPCNGKGCYHTQKADLALISKEVAMRNGCSTASASRRVDLETRRVRQRAESTVTVP